MADNYPQITASDVKAADRAREKQFFLAVFTAGAVASTFHALEAPGGRLGRFVQKGYTGVDIHPRPGQMPSASIGKGFFLTGLLPSPVGYVPAEVYGLHPNAVEQAAGFHVGKHLPFVSADQSRVKEYQARIVAEGIVTKAVGPLSEYATYGPHRSKIPPGPARVADDDLAYLRSLPETLSPTVTLFLREVDAGRVTILPPLAEVKNLPAAVTGHLVHLVQPGGATVEAIETTAGNYVRIDATGRAFR